MHAQATFSLRYSFGCMGSLCAKTKVKQLYHVTTLISLFGRKTLPRNSTRETTMQEKKQQLGSWLAFLSGVTQLCCRFGHNAENIMLCGALDLVHLTETLVVRSCIM
jgi:hypothetical protein